MYILNAMLIFLNEISNGKTNSYYIHCVHD